MDAEIHADEAAHWDVLHGFYETKRINHSRAYSDGFGCPNQAESYFSRLRRAVVGQHHHVSPQYLYQYANEAAWREDHSRQSNGTQFNMVPAPRFTRRSAGPGRAIGSGPYEVTNEKVESDQWVTNH